MATHAPAASAEAEILRHQARSIHRVVCMQADGITHEESIVPPQPAGNSFNWVVGHLITVYNNALPLLQQEPVASKEALEPYQRGSLPLDDPGKALPLPELLSLWETASERFDAGLAALPPERLDDLSPFSPTGNPNETVRTLLSTITFHQAYHTGQTAILRRIVGKPGAIK